MQVVQRGVMLILAVLLLLSGKCAMLREHMKQQQEQWEEMQTERFLGKIAGTGACTYDDLIVYQESLQHSGAGQEIRLEEYRKEEALAGEEYWYLVTWEEILDVLIKEGRYEFQRGSALELNVRNSVGIGGMRRSYYEVVMGKE